MPAPIIYADQVVPVVGSGFGIPYSDEGARAIAQLPADKLTEFAKLQAGDPVTYGWSYPSWSGVVDNWAKSQIHVVLGGNRCLHGDTLLTNPYTGEQTPVKDIRWRHMVLAHSGFGVVKAVANIPFIKGREAMVRVILDNNESFAVTRGHEVLGGHDGSWVRAGDLRAGSVLVGAHGGFQLVTAIEPLPGEHDVWDFEVPGYGNYVLGGVIHHNSSKSTMAARLALWVAMNVPGAKVRCWSANEESSINDQQRMVWNELPAAYKNLPKKRYAEYDVNYTMKNGFTGGKLVLPPVQPGYEPSLLLFQTYKSWANDDKVAEGWWAHMIWCLAEGEQVQMADGTMKRIEDVRNGDYVLTISKTGKRVARKVTATKYSGEKECVMVQPRVGTPVVCTKDHEIYWGYGADSKTEAHEAKRMAQIRPGWWPEVTHDRPDAWYAWAGLVVSEGYIPAKKITSGSVDVVGGAIAMLPQGASCRRYDHKDEHVPDWFLNWPEFWAEWPDQRSETKEIPNWVFTSSKAKAVLFLRYLYQGDGWAHRHRIGYATTSRVLATQLAVLLNRLGIRASLSIRKSKIKNWRDQYWVSIIKASEVIKFVETVGIVGKEASVAKTYAEAERRLLSSKSRATHLVKTGASIFADRAEQVRNKSSRVTKIIPFGTHKVYDISVEGEHRFLCGTSLVSNCDEEIPPKLYETLQYRLRDANGRLVVTFTTINGWTPTVQAILGKAKTLKKRHAPLVNRELPVQQIGDPTGRVLINYLWSQDNIFLPMDVRMGKDMAGKPESEILARQYGVPTKGKVAKFPLFNKDVHVVPHAKIPVLKEPAKWTWHTSLDPAGSKNWFMLWGATDAAGRLWITHEWPDAQTYGEWVDNTGAEGGRPGPAQKGMGFGIKDYVEQIEAVEEALTGVDADAVTRVIDPRMGASETQGENGAETIISRLDDAGYVYLPAPGKQIEDGEQMVNDFLSYDTKRPVGVDNSPRLFISDKCENLIQAMELYAGTGKDEPAKDPVDALRYMLQSGVEYIDPDAPVVTGGGSY